MAKASHKALLVVLSSPSGGGKTTLLDKILTHHPAFKRSISVTTRPRRKGEKDGMDYHFVSMSKFKRMAKAGQLAEWAIVHGNYYGTPKKMIEDADRRGRTLFFSLDYQGALSIKKKYPGAVLIFILPPSWSELKRRLTTRQSESKESLATRLRNARKELRQWRKYDYVIINRELHESVKDVEAIILAEGLRPEHFAPQGSGLDILRAT